MVFAQTITQHHRILQRCAAAPPISGVVLCAASPSSATWPRTGCRRAQCRGFQCGWWYPDPARRSASAPAAPSREVTREIGSEGGAIFRQTEGKRDIKRNRSGHRRRASATHACLLPRTWSTGGRGNLFINLHQPVPVNVTGVAALGVYPSTYGRTAEWLPSAAIRKSPVAVLPSVNVTLTPASSSRTCSTRLPNCTRSRPQKSASRAAVQRARRAGASSGALQQRGAKAGQRVAAPVILVGHKTHRPAVCLNDVAHAEVLHAFHPVGPDGDGRANGFDLFTASNTVQSMPAFSSATAALRPPMPAPMTIAFMLLSFCRVSLTSAICVPAAECGKGRCGRDVCTAKVRYRGGNAFYESIISGLGSGINCFRPQARVACFVQCSGTMMTREEP